MGVNNKQRRAVSDALGEAARLEQERVDWAWVQDRIPYD